MSSRYPSREYEDQECSRIMSTAERMKRRSQRSWRPTTCQRFSAKFLKLNVQRHYRPSQTCSFPRALQSLPTYIIRHRGCFRVHPRRERDHLSSNFPLNSLIYDGSRGFRAGKANKYVVIFANRWVKWDFLVTMGPWSENKLAKAQY